MIDELFLYDRDSGLFKNILTHSSVIGGRYFVSPDYGRDLNTDSLNQFFSDAAYGMKDVAQKYPACVCIVPKSFLVNEGGILWEGFQFTLFFLCTTFQTGNNQIKTVNKPTLTSAHHIWYDWKDMKEVGVNFCTVLNNFLRNTQDAMLRQSVRFDPDKTSIRRISKTNNDQLSGVSFTLQIYLYSGNCDINDYPDDVLSQITIPSTSIHALHKH